MTRILTKDSRYNPEVVEKVRQSFLSNGVYIDLRKANELANHLDKKQSDAFEGAYALVSDIVDRDTLNLSSPKQVPLLFAEKYPVDKVMHLMEKTGKGAVSYNSKSLKIVEGILKYELAKHAREYKSFKSIKSKVMELVRFTTAFNDADTFTPEIFLNETTETISKVYPSSGFGETNRLSYNNPGLSNVSPIVRSAITAPDGYKILSVDYKQQEPYFLANMLGIKELIDLMRDYGDFYQAMTKLLTGEELTAEDRDVAKLAWLAISYGGTLHTIQYKLKNDHQLNLAKKLLEGVPNIPEILTYKEELKANVMNTRMVESYFGTVRSLPVYLNKSQIIRTAFNNTFQITGADMLYFAFESVLNKLEKLGLAEDEVRIYLSIHDEILFLVRDDIANDELVSEIKEAVEIQIEDWDRIKTDHTLSKTYDAKDDSVGEDE